MVEAIINDWKRIIPCGVWVDGEYGQNDLAIGVPVVLGKEGWEKIVELPLTETEKEAFAASADATRKLNQILIESGIL
jgi:malate dehydrogenase